MPNKTEAAEPEIIGLIAHDKASIHLNPNPWNGGQHDQVKSILTDHRGIKTALAIGSSKNLELHACTIERRPGFFVVLCDGTIVGSISATLVSPIYDLPKERMEQMRTKINEHKNAAALKAEQERAREAEAAARAEAKRIAKLEAEAAAREKASQDSVIAGLRA